MDAWRASRFFRCNSYRSAPWFLRQRNTLLSSSDPNPDTLFWHSFWHTIWKYMYTCLKLDIYIYSDIRSGIHSDIFSGILSGIIKILPANSEGCYLLDIYFWHRVSCFCHLACHFFVVFSSGAGGWIQSRPRKSKNVILCNLFVLCFVMFVVFL